MSYRLLCAVLAAVVSGCGGGEDPEPAAAPPPIDEAAFGRAAVTVADACQDDTQPDEVRRAVDTALAAHRADPGREVGHGDGPQGAVPITVRDELRMLAVDLEHARCPAGRAARKRLLEELAR